MHNYLRIYILYILSLNKYDKYEELYRTLLSVVIEPSNLLEACASAELCAEQCSLVETESSENVILEPLFSTTLWINLANDFSYSILMAHGFSKYCTVHSYGQPALHSNALQLRVGTFQVILTYTFLIYNFITYCT